MLKSIWESFKAWRVIMFQRWWDMIVIPATLLPLITGTVLILSWALNPEPKSPIPNWYLYVFGSGVILFIGFSFWAFHQMRLEKVKLEGKLKAGAGKAGELFEMRSSKFYDVTATLDEMRERLDYIAETKPAKFKKTILLSLLKDVTNITGTTKVFSKILRTKKLTQAYFSNMQTAMTQKWTNLSTHPFGEETRKFMIQLNGIYKHYKVDISSLARKDRKYRGLLRSLKQQRHLVLCDGTLRTIEEYLFFLEGYENDYMDYLISDGEQLRAVLTTEQKSQMANFKKTKDMLLEFLINKVVLSIDKFITETNTGA